MTRNERTTAFRLRLEGRSWEEIGQQIGYTAHAVEVDLTRCLRRPAHQIRAVYPALARAINQRWNGSVAQFSAACGIRPRCMYRLLDGSTLPRLERMHTILSVTGLTFEEAFARALPAEEGRPAEDGERPGADGAGQPPQTAGERRGAHAAL